MVVNAQGCTYESQVTVSEKWGVPRRQNFVGKKLALTRVMFRFAPPFQPGPRRCPLDNAHDALSEVHGHRSCGLKVANYRLAVKASMFYSSSI